ncbi:helix-turn-helix transcriptional regulator [Solibacillus cecembensis]|uniref:helix-turn-helix transcriptional regulator n=1 Tax=Solibacillus cecembensis TaxID=459347 RepID=UPI003D047FB6
MDKKKFIDSINNKLKLIRIENNYSQEKMSEIVGISKKTLIEIEKGRSSLTWAGAVCIATLFEHSEIIQMTFGGDVNEVIKTVAFTHYEPSLPKTLGGKVWWRQFREFNGYKIQQNILSHHYRILDEEDRKICSSFELDEIELRFKEITNN